MHSLGRKMWAGLAGAVALILLAGCGSETAGSGQDVIDVAGVYTSQGEVGTLGTLVLLLERVEQSSIFTAELSGTEEGELEPVEGIGTVGDHHLILNFNQGQALDYYFEGQIELNGEAVERLSGQFVFPDQTETLPVVFNLQT